MIYERQIEHERPTRGSVYSCTPQLWQKLRLNDYDMLYFFFEEPLKNFIKMGETLRKKPSVSQEFINAIENY